MTPDVQTSCRCGHARTAHDHFRRGTDCATCGNAGCASFRPAASRWDRVMQAFARHAPEPEQQLATVVAFPRRDVPIRRSA